MPKRDVSPSSTLRAYTSRFASQARVCLPTDIVDDVDAMPIAIELAEKH